MAFGRKLLGAARARLADSLPSISLLWIAVDGCGQHVAAQVGDAVVDGAAHLGCEGQHGAQDFTERGQIVLRRPRAQLQQVLAEERLFIKHSFEVPHFDVGRGIGCKRRDNSDQLFIAEGHDDTGSALRRLARSHTVGEGVVKRHGQRDFAVRRHGRQDSV